MAKAKMKVSASVHDFRSSRVEKAALELDSINKTIAELEARKKTISAKLLKATYEDGERDAKGKMRYETDLHKFVIIPGSNIYTDAGKMAVALMSEGLTPKQIARVKVACVKKTEYEYVGVYKKKDAAAADVEAAS